MKRLIAALFNDYLPFAAATTASAFLLFQLEPLAGKKILPYLGGGASVWATTLLLFTIIVFLGYLYVYFATQLSAPLQKGIHTGLLVLAVLWIIASVSLYQTLFPFLSFFAALDTPPYLKVFLALVSSIGLPFFVLSATGPLLQHWYGHASGKEPYQLYAFSNAGSLAALLTFPFVFEPVLRVSAIEKIWAVSFLLCALVLAYIAIFSHKKEDRVLSGAMPLADALKVVAYAALASGWLVAVTTQLTHVVAPVPLLWVVPLSLYLLSFIVAFAGYTSIYTPLLTGIAAVVSYVAMRGGYSWTGFTIIAYNTLLFLAAVLCHSRVYALRPRALPYFYAAVSFGGMVGALLASLIAPLVFKDVFEFPIGLALIAALCLWIMPTAFFPRIMSDVRILNVRIVGVLLIGILLGSVVTEKNGWFIYQTRNFYGVAKVSDDYGVTRLYHDHTLHGFQYQAAEKRMMPTSYYTASSGIGKALIYARFAHGTDPITVGMIGLGTGSVAAYCADGDTFTFYEIDQRIVDVARDYFTYLSHCKGSSVHMGDARLTLERELASGKPGTFDVLAIDAFNDDSVPTHLLTKEALALYLSHLRSPQSLIVFHASSRYFYISPVVLTLAKDAGLTAKVVISSNEDTAVANSMWVVLARDPAVFESTAFKDVPAWYPYKVAPLWTDDFVNVAAALSIPFTIPFF